MLARIWSERTECPEPEVCDIASFWGIVPAEALDGSKDVISGPVPSERFGIGVVSVDERCDVSAEGSDAAIDAAPNLLIRKEREEAVDLVAMTNLSGSGARANGAF